MTEAYGERLRRVQREFDALPWLLRLFIRVYFRITRWRA